MGIFQRLGGKLSEISLLLLPECFPSPFGIINVSEPAITALTKHVIN